MCYFEPEAQLTMEFVESVRDIATAHVSLPLEADAKVRPMYAKSTEALSPGPPIPLGNSYIATTTPAQNSPAPLSDEQFAVVAKKLTQFGVAASVVDDLVRRLPQRAERWSRAISFVDRSKISNPGGWMRAAIETGKYAFPAKFLAAERAEAERPARSASRDLTEQQLRLQAEAANKQLLDSLPASMRYIIELEVDEKMSAPPLNAFPPGARRNIRDGMILKAAQERMAGAVA